MSAGPCLRTLLLLAPGARRLPPSGPEMLWSDRPTQAYVFRTCSEQGVTVALARLESVRAGRVRAPQIVRCPAREHDFHSASKLALDFLLRRATMTARQL